MNNSNVEPSINTTLLAYATVIQIFVFSPVILLLNAGCIYLIERSKFIDSSLKLFIFVSIFIDLFLTAGLCVRAIHMSLFFQLASTGNVDGIRLLDSKLTCKLYLDLTTNPGTSGLFLLIAITIERIIETRQDRDGTLTWKHWLMASTVFIPFVLHRISLSGEKIPFSRYFCSHFLEAPVQVILPWVSAYVLVIGILIFVVGKIWKRLLKAKSTYLSTNENNMTPAERYRLEQSTNSVRMLFYVFMTHLLVTVAGLLLNAVGSLLVQNRPEFIEEPLARDIGLAISSWRYLFGALARPLLIMLKHPNLKAKLPNWIGKSARTVGPIPILTVTDDITSQHLEMLRATWDQKYDAVKKYPGQNRLCPIPPQKQADDNIKVEYIS